MNYQKDLDGIQHHWPEYEIEEILGKGGYGQVYKVHKHNFGVDSYSAIKVIHIPPDNFARRHLRSLGMTDADIKSYYEKQVNSFLREYAIMEKLRSAANIVILEDCKVDNLDDGNAYTIYIKMELLISMEELQSNCQLGPKDIIKIGSDICDALIVCDQMNIVHRDIKPANVFVNSFGTYKLGDFGIAKEIDHTFTDMTAIGTVAYMAPEIHGDQKVDKRVDIYSLGIMLYRLANYDRFPFVNPDDMVTPEVNHIALVKRQAGLPLPLPGQVNEELGRVIIKACDNDPQKRFRNAKEFKDALLSCNVTEILPSDKQPEDDEETLLKESEGDEETLLKESEGDEETLLKEPEGDEETLLKESEGDEETLLMESEGDEETLLMESEGDEETLLMESESEEKTFPLGIRRRRRNIAEETRRRRKNIAEGTRRRRRNIAEGTRRR